MPLYLTISRGPSAATARPVIAVGDQALIRDVLDKVARLGSAEPANRMRSKRQAPAEEAKNDVA